MLPKQLTHNALQRVVIGAKYERTQPAAYFGLSLGDHALCLFDSFRLGRYAEQNLCRSREDSDGRVVRSLDQISDNGVDAALALPADLEDP